MSIPEQRHFAVLDEVRDASRIGRAPARCGHRRGVLVCGGPPRSTTDFSGVKL